MASPKSVPEEARGAGLFTIDATCPLVTKVHREAQVHFKRGRHIILIGHAGHPEVVGTMGQLPPGAVTLVATVEDVEALAFPDERDLAYVTQTTLSVDDTRDVVTALQRAVSREFTPRRSRGHLLRHDQPPGGDQAGRAAWSRR